MLISASFKRDFLLKQSDAYLRKAGQTYYFTKWAQGSAQLLAELDNFVDSVKNEGLFNKLSELQANYKSFLEELTAGKDLSKAAKLSMDVLESMNNIAGDPYINVDKDGFFQEDDDFDQNELLSLLTDISSDVQEKTVEIVDTPEYDEAAEIKSQVISLLNQAKKDPEFVKLLESGGINNAIKYLKEKAPELIQLMAKIENISDLSAQDWKEIQSDMSHSTMGKYDPNLRIINRHKQKEAKEVWVARNPKKYLESKQREWKSLKSDPSRYEKYLQKKRVSNKQQYEKHQEHHKARQLKRWEEIKKERPEVYDVQKLRNKFVVVKARDFAKKIAKEILLSNKDAMVALNALSGAEREAARKQLIDSLMSQSKEQPKYKEFILNLPATLHADREFKSLNPEIQEEILKAIGRLRNK